MKIRVEGETIVFDYERKHLEPGDDERIGHIYQVLRTALLAPAESGNRRADCMDFYLSVLGKDSEWAIDFAEINYLRRELETEQSEPIVLKGI